MAARNVVEDVKNTLNQSVPMQIRNGVTKLMKEEGYGKGYQYAHDSKDKITDMQTMPDNLVGHEYYYPTEQGHEIRFKKRLEQIKQWHEEYE
ncbi:hypothetical protein GCM10022297_13020 [Lactobacillus hamsteri]